MDVDVYFERLVCKNTYFNQRIKASANIWVIPVHRYALLAGHMGCCGGSEQAS